MDGAMNTTTPCYSPSIPLGLSVEDEHRAPYGSAKIPLLCNAHKQTSILRIFVLFGSSSSRVHFQATITTLLSKGQGQRSTVGYTSAKPTSRTFPFYTLVTIFRNPSRNRLLSFGLLFDLYGPPTLVITCVVDSLVIDFIIPDVLSLIPRLLTLPLYLSIRIVSLTLCEDHHVSTGCEYHYCHLVVEPCWANISATQLPPQTACITEESKISRRCRPTICRCISHEQTHNDQKGEMLVNSGEVGKRYGVRIM